MNALNKEELKKICGGAQPFPDQGEAALPNLSRVGEELLVDDEGNPTKALSKILENIFAGRGPQSLFIAVGEWENS